jgi:hypothetical protein
MTKAQRRNDHIVAPDYEVERDNGYVTERFRSNGELHRDEGPAVVQRHVASDCVVYGKPAELAFDLDTGLCGSSTRWENGERVIAFFKNREGGPCRILIYRGGPKEIVCTLRGCNHVCMLRSTKPFFPDA